MGNPVQGMLKFDDGSTIREIPAHHINVNSPAFGDYVMVDAGAASMIKLVDASSSDATPVRIQGSSGVYSLSQQVYNQSRLYDDFEDNSLTSGKDDFNTTHPIQSAGWGFGEAGEPRGNIESVNTDRTSWSVITGNPSVSSRTLYMDSGTTEILTDQSASGFRESEWANLDHIVNESSSNALIRIQFEFGNGWMGYGDLDYSQGETYAYVSDENGTTADNSLSSLPSLQSRHTFGVGWNNGNWYTGWDGTLGTGVNIYDSMSSYPNSPPTSSTHTIRIYVENGGNVEANWFVG